MNTSEADGQFIVGTTCRRSSQSGAPALHCGREGAGDGASPGCQVPYLAGPHLPTIGCRCTPPSTEWNSLMRDSSVRAVR
jgi:hypothetical protein